MLTKFYSTPTGLEILNKKLNSLKEQQKEALHDLKNAQEGNNDLSENNEYMEAKDRLHKVEDDKAKLEDQISKTHIIEVNDEPKEKVIFGALVEIYDIDQDKEFSYRIVGEEEADIKENKISYTSPLAKAIIGKKIGEEAIFDLPNGEDRCVEIINVR